MGIAWWLASLILTFKYPARWRCRLRLENSEAVGSPGEVSARRREGCQADRKEDRQDGGTIWTSASGFGDGDASARTDTQTIEELPERLSKSADSRPTLGG